MSGRWPGGYGLVELSGAQRGVAVCGNVSTSSYSSTSLVRAGRELNRARLVYFARAHKSRKVGARVSPVEADE